jgi:hypothetical protein
MERAIFELLVLTKKCLNAYIKNDDFWDYHSEKYLNYEIHMVYNRKMLLLVIDNVYFKNKYCYKDIEEIFKKINLYLTENIYIVTLDDSCKLIEHFIKRYNKKIKFVLMINYLNVIIKKIIVNKIKKYGVKYTDLHVNFLQNLLLYHQNEKLLSKLFKMI